jgi:predicted nucleic acid-binding protein
MDQVEAWLESPSLVLLAESGEHWSALRSALTAGRIVGPRVHDARVAALCVQHNVRELWSADRDFSRFPALKTINPLTR